MSDTKLSDVFQGTVRYASVCRLPRPDRRIRYALFGVQNQLCVSDQDHIPVLTGRRDAGFQLDAVEFRPIGAFQVFQQKRTLALPYQLTMDARNGFVGSKD